MRQITADAGQQNEARVQFLYRHQLAEIDGVFRHDHSVLGDTSRQDDMIWLAKAADVARVEGIMLASGVEPACNLRRQAFVDEQPQAAFAQGRPPGLPTRG